MRVLLQYPLGTSFFVARIRESIVSVLPYKKCYFPRSLFTVPHTKPMLSATRAPRPSVGGVLMFCGLLVATRITKIVNYFTRCQLNRTDG